MKRWSVAGVIAALLVLTACGQERREGAPEPGTSTPAAPSAPAAPTGAAVQPGAATADAAGEALRVYAKRCQVCHGASGHGDGPGATALNPKPRSFEDAAWQSSVSDERIETAIAKGGAAVGLSPAMPPSPDLARKPELMAELVKMIRGFGKR